MQQELDVLIVLVDASKLQNERSKNATMMIQKERWCQKGRNKEIRVLKREPRVYPIF
jgi:hypothetical protein